VRFQSAEGGFGGRPSLRQQIVAEFRFCDLGSGTCLWMVQFDFAFWWNAAYLDMCRILCHWTASPKFPLILYVGDFSADKAPPFRRGMNKASDNNGGLL